MDNKKKSSITLIPIMHSGLFIVKILMSEESKNITFSTIGYLARVVRNFC